MDQYRALCCLRFPLLLFEHVVPPGGGPSFAKLLDLNMIVISGGRERTEEEFRALLDAAGFRLARLIPTPAMMSVLEAVPAPKKPRQGRSGGHFVPLWGSYRQLRLKLFPT